MSLTGYSIGVASIRTRSEPRTGPLMAQVSEMARSLSMAMCVGYPEKEGDRIFNAAAVFDDTGRLIHHYRKTHLFGAYELAVFTPGGAGELACSRLNSSSKPGSLAFGLMICMDCEYPEPARLLALQGAEIIILPTALGAGPVQHLTPRCVVPTRALENHIFIAYANFCGPAAGPDDSAFVGQSAVIGPDGMDLCRAPGPESIHRHASVDSACVRCADVESAAFAADVARNPYLTARRPELYAAISDAAACAAAGRA
ncbi:unnamed protein product [Polarella glacialis]|uniref:CN hydrolase domain-containing protein n=1 Tax=Polarella glacialis TaxID=89957 RepID=A0A813LQV1_POLGL|nr:unnamed protein product [Polarella glacialis]CAE8737289.1 unnamed protein product [Polarella glacialis]